MGNISVLGCGVVGLSTAILLLRDGRRVDIYCRDLPIHTASTVACATWIPFGTAENYSDSYLRLLRKWSNDSLQEFEKLVSPEYGIRWIKNHELFRSKSDVPAYIWQLADILPDFEATQDDSLPSSFEYRVSFNTLVIETQPYIKRLMEDFLGLGGKIFERTFHTAEELEQLNSHVIFNCTGLGARNLFGDVQLIPVKGQLLMHVPLTLDIALGFDEYCLVPRTDALIMGALWQPSFEDAHPTHENAELIWDHVKQMFGSPGSTVEIPSQLIDRSRIFSTVAALRPFRHNGIRVEAQTMGDRLIVHNYGHGGGGVSLSWGTSYHAISLFTER